MGESIVPLNITVHSALTSSQGISAQAPTFDGNTTAQVVALGAASTPISGPALLCVIADEDQRIGISATAGYTAPAASGVKLKAGVERYLSLSASGPWYVSAVAG